MYRVWNLGNAAPKRALLGLLIALAFALPAISVSRAQEITDEHFKIAKETVAASRATDMLDNILPNMSEAIKKQLIANNPDEADKISGIVDDVAISLAPRRGDLEDEVARAFARIFTIDELKAIKAFYESEPGKKLIEQTPVIAGSIDQAANVWTNGIRRDLQQEVNKKLAAAGQ